MHTFLVVSMEGKRIATVAADNYEEAVHHTTMPRSFTEHKFSTWDFNPHTQTYSRHHVATISTPLGSSVIRGDSGAIDIEKPDA